MGPRYRLDHAHTGPRHVWLGLAVSSQCREVGGVLIELGDTPGGLRPAILASAQVKIAEETAGLFAHVGNNPHCPLVSITTLREQLTVAEADLATRLLQMAQIEASRVTALGVQDPGLWLSGQQPGASSGYLGLCDPARLAELCQIDVIDAFPARDLAQNGQGGPLSALPQWMLLHDSRTSRALLDLGQTVRISYLPAASVSNAIGRILAFDAGPGMRILDLLAQRLTSGQSRFDPGGRLAVQGRRVPELLRHWLSDPYFERPLPRWHPRGVRPERFLGEAMPKAVEAGWSVRDLLCTATHFLAEVVSQSLHRRLPDEPPVEQIVVTGGGQHNGMLLREIQTRVPDLPILRIDDVLGSGELLEPACAAVLAWMYLHRMPANGSAITGASVCGVLGRLTPGRGGSSPLPVQLGTHLLGRDVRAAG